MAESRSITSRDEIRQLVGQQLQYLLEKSNWEGIKTLLVSTQPVDVAEAINTLQHWQQVIVFRLLPKHKFIAVYEHLDPSIQQDLLVNFKRQESIDIVEGMSPDERIKLFDELPAELISELLNQLSPKERQATAWLLGYSEGSAGRLMTTKYIALYQEWTVAGALEEIRYQAQASETIYSLPVIDSKRQLCGTISLREIVLASTESHIQEIITRDVISVWTDTDQEEAARMLQRYDLIALPVIDREQYLVGIITFDDIIDILEQETTEDIYTLSGVQTAEKSYFRTSIATATRKRIFWLVLLLVTNTFTSMLIDAQQDVLQAIVILSTFIPLLIDTGGNVGAQSSTVFVRGLSTSELSKDNILLALKRELFTGAILGSMMGLVAGIWAFFMQGDSGIALTVGITLFAIAILASFVGSVLPYFLKSFKFDPALISAPLITTIMDITGIWLYFQTARHILHERLDLSQLPKLFV